MLRTNSKAARQNVIEYIKQDQDYILEEYDVEPKNDAELLAEVYWIFKSEKGPEFHRYSSDYNMFKDWAKELALCGLFCYYYNRSAVEDLGEILEETETERNKYSEEQAEELLTRLIYREVQDAFYTV